MHNEREAERQHRERSLECILDRGHILKPKKTVRAATFNRVSAVRSSPARSADMFRKKTRYKSAVLEDNKKEYRRATNYQ
jgi:hypothetical protein